MMPFFVPIYFGSHVGDVDIGALFILLGVIGLLTAAFSSCYDSYPSATLTSAFQFKEEVVPEEEKRLNRQQWRYAVPMILLFALTVVEGIYSLKNSMAGAMVACLCQIIMLFSCGFALSTKHIQRYRVIDKDTYDAEYPANTTRHVEVTCGFVGLICAIGAVVMYGIQYFNPKLLGQTSPEMLLVYFLQSLCFLMVPILFFHGLYKKYRVNKYCTKDAYAKVVKCNKSNTGLSCPVLELEHNGKKYYLCSQIFERKSYSVGEVLPIHVNPDDPYEISYTKADTSRTFIMGAIATVLAVICIICFFLW